MADGDHDAPKGDDDESLLPLDALRLLSFSSRRAPLNPRKGVIRALQTRPSP